MKEHKHFYLIFNGIARVFYFRDGKDITVHIAQEQESITAIDSFIQRSKSKYIWTDSHQVAFDNIKQKLCDITLNNQFDKSLPLRIRCDTSHAGLGCCLEQYKEYEWQPIAFASRFLKSCEQKYSTNELELLGVVWSCEHFRHYLFGSSFTV